MTLKEFIKENSGKLYDTPVFMMYYIVIDYDEYFDKILKDEKAIFLLRSKLITLEKIENDNDINKYYISDDKLKKIYIECSQNGRLDIFDTTL